MNNEQMGVIRNEIQKKMPDVKVVCIWFLATTIDNHILYGVSGNNNKFLAVADISPEFEIVVRK